MKAWFVTSPSALNSEIPGGVQLCSREFLSILRAGFPETEIVHIGHSRGLADRLHKRFGTAPYRLFSPAEFREIAEGHIRQKGRPDVVFLNMCETTRLAETVKTIDSKILVVLLSHGTQTGDDLYEASGAGGIRNQGVRGMVARFKLGMDLCLESDYRRRFLDMVGVMSEEEQILEKWLGAPSTFLLPRLVRAEPLVACPVPGRVGYVGTLDHTPNVVGLRRTLENFAKKRNLSLEVRIVGGPLRHGERLCKDFPGVSYLGPLSNEALRAEAATWSAFFNPIYWLSKGASMKLAQALGWKIPFVSTASGARGYIIPGLEEWIVDDQPESLVSGVLRQLELGSSGRARFEAAWEASKARWPTSEIVGRHLKEKLIG